MALTVRKVDQIEEAGRYPDGHGLYLQVTETKAKSWLLRYERHGRERWMGLGPIHTVTLPEARERARKARQMLLDGKDPIDQRRADRAAAAANASKQITFEAAARAYFDQHADSWKSPTHRAQFLSTLTAYAFPILGPLPIVEIDTGLVLRVLEPIWRTKTETASRVRGRVEAVLDWATVRGYRAGENPARWKGHLAQALPTRSKIAPAGHHAAMAYSSVPGFLVDLRTRSGISARALEFLILTAARTGEVVGATWDEIDLTEKVWTVPASRIKAGREHRVPLSDRAVEIIRGLPSEHGNNFVFIGPRRAGLSNMAMAELLKRMGQADVTVHGFRSTFRDWAAERTNYPNHVAEMALAHAIGDKVERAYRRGVLLDKRRRLMSDWAEYCLKGERMADLIALPRAG